MKRDFANGGSAGDLAIRCAPDAGTRRAIHRSEARWRSSSRRSPRLDRTSQAGPPPRCGGERTLVGPSGFRPRQTIPRGRARLPGPRRLGFSRATPGRCVLRGPRCPARTPLGTRGDPDRTLPRRPRRRGARGPQRDDARLDSPRLDPGRIPVSRASHAARPHPEPELPDPARRRSGGSGFFPKPPAPTRRCGGESRRTRCGGRRMAASATSSTRAGSGCRRGAGRISANIRCPTLLLRGEESALLTHEGALEIVSAIPDARLVEIPGAGHHVHIDRPALVLPAMLEFLSHHGCAGAPPPSDVHRRS